MSYVYIIASPSGRMKIGKTGNPKRRLQQMRVDERVDLILEYAREVENSTLVESIAHAILKEKRHHGEWFAVTLQEAIDAVNSALASVLDGTWVENKKQLPKSHPLCERCKANREATRKRMHALRTAAKP